MFRTSFFLLFLYILYGDGEDILLHTDSCPQVLNCRCVNGKIDEIQCFGVGKEKVREIRKIYGENVKRLEFEDWQEDILNFNDFSDFEALTDLKIVDSELEQLNLTTTLDSLKTLFLDHNELSKEEEICDVVSLMPNLQTLSLRRNYLESFRCETPKTLKELDLAGNKIKELEMTDFVEKLNISHNSLTQFNNISMENLRVLDVSNNLISSWPDMPVFPKLQVLFASMLQFDTGFEISAPLLEVLNLDDSTFRFLDFHRIKTEKLKKFSAANLVHLQVVAGKLAPSVEDFVLTRTKIFSLPSDFFGEDEIESNPTVKKRSVKSTKNVNVSSTVIKCEKCLLKWSLPVFEQSGVKDTCNITKKEISSADCAIGISNADPIRWGFYGKDAILECPYYGTPTPNIRWFRYRPETILGGYDPNTDEINYDNVTNLTKESYEIISGGSLVIKSANRSHIERYICMAENTKGKVFEVIQFRLDYTSWYSFNVFHSVFYGGLAMALIVCLISFLLNITWILTRKSALWWIQRAERLSRVRKMVEAMEKYRVRQMESLHDKYTKRVQIVRDNYHQQVEALRVSYSSQSEKFRDYRAQQMESVSSHLEAVRDNYNTQLARVREYGSKRAEVLWESYERQANRMRTFSLQHRLKMMRQYKVKQRYLNKLLESLQTSSPDVKLENEEKVRAALDIADELAPIDEGTINARLSRASSFHSLPEYLIDERGNVQPGIPASGAEIRIPPRFSRMPESFNSSAFQTKKLTASQKAASQDVNFAANEPSTSTKYN